MLRKTNSKLHVWDPAARSEVTLGPGKLLRSCSVRRHNQDEVKSGADTYDVEFLADGRQYICPLFRFQPRTDTVESPQFEIDAIAI
jgi:hypothetical protein